MANEEKVMLAKIATPTDVVSDAISRALVDKVVLVPFVFAEDLPVGTPIKQARKDSALGSAVTRAEATAHTLAENVDNFTQSKVQLTTAKSVIASQITVEAIQFGEVSDEQIISKQSNSIARALDAAIKALAAGFTGSVDAGAAMTAEALLEAVMLISAGNAAEDNSPCVAALTPKQVFQIQKQLIQSGATAWSNIQMLSLLQTLEQPNGYAGSLPGGVDVYRVNGLPTNAGKTRAMVFNPALAFFGVYGTVQVWRSGLTAANGLCNEIGSYVFNQVAEWNDAAGKMVESTT
jgi:hypothetical protein